MNFANLPDKLKKIHFAWKNGEKPATFTFCPYFRKYQ